MYIGFPKGCITGGKTNVTQNKSQVAWKLLYIQGGKHYGSTTQFTGYERQQTVRYHNNSAGKIHREIIFWLQS